VVRPLIGTAVRNTWLGAWSIPLGLLSGASILLASMFAEWLERGSPAGTKGISGRWGFDPDDALYLMGPLAWLGWLSPILVGASVGATAVMIITGVRLQRQRRA
jgi:archaetidylinositol phosphate synthase